jgi:hypothetical protein
MSNRTRTKQFAEAHVVVVLQDFTLWMLKHTNRFPKNWRITLGDRLDNLLLDMVANVQRASVRGDKRALLHQVNEDLHVLRALLRTTVELGCLGPRQYEYASGQVEEIGRQIGGWLKQQRARHANMEKPVS